jgi:Arc/MetJ family transcription regulator
MRTTVNIDDDLLAKAAEYTGVKERSALLRMALEGLVAREAEKRLARLGGSMPDFGKTPVSRRRFPSE